MKLTEDNLFFFVFSDSEVLKDPIAKITGEKRIYFSAISSALVLGTALGVGETFVLSFAAGPVLDAMGVGAVRYLAQLTLHGECKAYTRSDCPPCFQLLDVTKSSEAMISTSIAHFCALSSFSG